MNTTKHHCEISCSSPITLHSTYVSTQANQMIVIHIPRFLILCNSSCVRLHLKCDGTRAETRLCLSAKRTSPFQTAGASDQSTTGSRGVRISGSNAGYTMFRGSEGYWLPTPFASFHFTSPPVSTCAITFQLDSTRRYFRLNA